MLTPPAALRCRLDGEAIVCGSGPSGLGRWVAENGAASSGRLVAGRSVGRRRRGRRCGPGERRQRLACDDEVHFVAVECLTLEQRGRKPVELVAVVDENVLRVLVRLAQQALELG